MPDKTICVKVSQRVLRTKATPYRYFPFDRVYLVRSRALSRFAKSFPYYLYMDLDTPLLSALHALHVNSIKEQRLQRDDRASAKKLLRSEEAFTDLVKSPRGWSVVVPTHVKVKRAKEGNKWVPQYSMLDYVVSRIVRYREAGTPPLPRIGLRTPHGNIPLLCATCAQLPNMHAGNCNPGTRSCSATCDVRFQIEKGEEAECPSDTDTPPSS